MILENLKQAPFNTTLMGTLHGAMGYYRIPVSDPYLFGMSGHAFLINIHPILCPSGPYCWNFTPMIELIRNLGIQITHHGFFHSGSSTEDRAVVEAIIRIKLDNGIPCYLLNMENQLITGYDDTGFITEQPWPLHDFPPAHLSFGSWEEIGEEFHINFFTLEKIEPARPHECVTASLKYAVDLWNNPASHTAEPNGAGPNGYANWRKAILDGYGNGHGGWWNGMVWSECRAQASKYFIEIAPFLPSSSEVNIIAKDYASISNLLLRCSDKYLDSKTKIPLIDEASYLESICVDRIEKILSRIAV